MCVLYIAPLSSNYGSTVCMINDLLYFKNAPGPRLGNTFLYISHLASLSQETLHLHFS